MDMSPTAPVPPSPPALPPPPSNPFSPSLPELTLGSVPGRRDEMEKGTEMDEVGCDVELWTRGETGPCRCRACFPAHSRPSPHPYHTKTLTWGTPRMA